MARPRPWEVSDELWALIGPLLPEHPRRFRHPGRRRFDDRKALQGILFVLYTASQLEFAAGAGIRVRIDVLAAVGRVAAGRVVGAAAAGAAGQAAGG